MVKQPIKRKKRGLEIGRNSITPQRREQIVWALYDCLAIKGQEEVTIKDIAAKAGLPNGIIHYYFTNKDEIVSSLAKALVEKYGRMLDDRLGKARTVEDRMEVFIDFAVNELICSQPLNRVFYNLVQMSFGRESLHQIIKDMLHDYRSRMAESFVSLRPGSKEHLIGAALVAVTEGFSLQCMIDPEAFRQEDIRELFAALTVSIKPLRESIINIANK